MKKLWVNTVPGKDINADQIFHYHQELPKYLRGFHKCSKEDAIKLGALILRSKVESIGDAQAYIQHNIKELVPADLMRASSGSEWKKNILSTYVKTCENISQEDAKHSFLEIIYRWPTFGSTFFEVKQTTEPSYPEVILVAINKKGVNIIHPLTKVCKL